MVLLDFLFFSASPCLAWVSGEEAINAFVRKVKYNYWFVSSTDFLILAGFYFPDVSAAEKYYNGSILEEEYEKKLMVKTRQLIFIYSRKKQLTRSLLTNTKGTQLEE